MPLQISLASPCDPLVYSGSTTPDLAYLEALLMFAAAIGLAGGRLAAAVGCPAGSPSGPCFGFSGVKWTL